MFDHQPTKTQVVIFFRRPQLAVGVLLLAFGLQMAYLTELQRLFPNGFEQPFCGIDAVAHHQRALGLLSGQYPGNNPWLFIPLYPAFLALLIVSLGASFFTPVLLQAIFSLITFATLYAIGSRLFSRNVGLVAMLLLLGYAPHLYYLPCLDQSQLTTPLLMLGIFFLIRFEARPQWRWLVLGAVVITASAFSRPTVLILLPAVVLWLWLYKSSLRQFISRAVCFGGVMILLILPITWHNYQTTGLFVPLSKNGGVNLHTGNNPDAIGIDLLAHAQSQPAVLRHIALQPSRSRGETSYSAEVWKYIREQPGDWLELTLSKVWLWFGVADKPLITPVFPLAIEDSMLLRRLPVTWQAAALTALLGFLLVYSRRPRANVLLGLIFGFLSVATIIFFIQLRFRLPVAPLVLLYAAALIMSGKKWRTEAPSWFWAMLLLLSIAYVWLPGLWIFILGLAGSGLSAAFYRSTVFRDRWLFAALWSWVVLGSFWGHIQAARYDVGQEIAHYLGVRLADSGVLGQTFTMDCANFDRLAIQLGVFDEQHDQPVTLTLAADRSVDNILASNTFDGAVVQDYDWRELTFEPLPDSQGQSYFFFISSPTSTPTNSLTARGYTDNPVDQYRGGQAFAGALDNLQVIEADFAFEATCRQTPWQQLKAGINKMAVERVWFSSSTAFYWLVLGLHLSLVAVAGVRLIQLRSRPHKM